MSMNFFFKLDIWRNNAKQLKQKEIFQMSRLYKQKIVKKIEKIVFLKRKTRIQHKDKNIKN